MLITDEFLIELENELSTLNISIEETKCKGQNIPNIADYSLHLLIFEGGTDHHLELRIEVFPAGELVWKVWDKWVYWTRRELAREGWKSDTETGYLSAEKTINVSSCQSKEETLINITNELKQVFFLKP